MEQALKPLCPNLAELGKPSRLLRAMSLLIVQTPQELVKQTVGSDSLVPSYIVLLLLFGHAGADLQSPHTTANWSNERLRISFQNPKDNRFCTNMNVVYDVYLKNETFYLA